MTKMRWDDAAKRDAARRPDEFQRTRDRLEYRSSRYLEVVEARAKERPAKAAATPKPEHQRPPPIRPEPPKPKPMSRERQRYQQRMRSGKYGTFP